MESKSFVYWLQGYFEISGSKEGLKKEQVDVIKKHLNMVFFHEIDPSYKDSSELSKIHIGNNHINNDAQEYQYHDGDASLHPDYHDSDPNPIIRC